MKLRVVCMMLIQLSFFSSAAMAQGESEYIDPEGKYRFKLVSEWRAVSFNDAVGRPRTEFVYRDRSEGLLKVARQSLSGSLADMLRQEEENLRVYKPGYQRVTLEPFGGGALAGTLLTFYSSESGRQMANTYYYLQDGNTVWVLRFSGKRGTLDINRNLTDQIARSFRTTAK